MPFNVHSQITDSVGDWLNQEGVLRVQRVIRT